MHDRDMPSLFGLALISFVCGALAALATRRRGAMLAGMAAGLAGALGGPWLSGALGCPIAPVWALLAGSVSAALLAAGLTALVPRRH
jgi:uncharacterized membrane protein YeaQ/YmgE (transglycosylase-associated protein family)